MSCGPAHPRGHPASSIAPSRRRERREVHRTGPDEPRSGSLDRSTGTSIRLVGSVATGRWIRRRSAASTQTPAAAAGGQEQQGGEGQGRLGRHGRRRRGGRRPPRSWRSRPRRPTTPRPPSGRCRLRLLGCPGHQPSRAATGPVRRVTATSTDADDRGRPRRRRIESAARECLSPPGLQRSARKKTPPPPAGGLGGGGKGENEPPPPNATAADTGGCRRRPGRPPAEAAR